MFPTGYTGRSEVGVRVRPAYAVTLVAGLLLAALAGWAVFGGIDPRSPKSPVASPTAGMEVEKVDAAEVGNPSPEKIAEMLDKVEKAEAEKLGEAEAHRRRLQREQILEQRLQRTGR